MRTVVTASLKPEIAVELKRTAEEDGVTVSSLISEAVEARLQDHKVKDDRNEQDGRGMETTSSR